jgi:hypothetical protein
MGSITYVGEEEEEEEEEDGVGGGVGEKHASTRTHHIHAYTSHI